MKNPYPKPETVQLSDGRKVSVPVFEFEEQLRSIVQNEEVFNEDNMIDDNFDKKNLRPIKSYEELDDDDTIGDLACGKLYHEALRYYVDGKEKPADVDAVYGLPIIVFTDEANHDTKGGNSSNPLAWCVGFFKEEVRRKLSSWGLVGFLPNINIGKGSNSGHYDHDWEIQGKKGP